MENQTKYLIGGKAYIQLPLVLGQINQLIQLLQGLTLYAGMNMAEIVAALGDRLPKALAIVLIDAEMEGRDSAEMVKYLRDRKINELAAEISFSIDPETPFEVIEDFFSINPIPSLLERFGMMAERLTGKIAAMKAGSKGSAPSSPEATSPKETPSSGASPSPSVGRT